MSQKLPIDGFKWKNNESNYDENFIRNYNRNSDKGYMLAVDAKYSKHLHDSLNDLSFFDRENRNSSWKVS